MAPSPENDNAPKAPDKGDKTKAADTQSTVTNLEISTSGSKEASVSGLDDIGLRALLDEAISYKTPKDRLGKSELFQNLLEKAEEDDRKARATSASGKESVRYYNTTAKHRTRRHRESSSISENLTHSGSLNNLTEEDLYAPASHLHHRLTKTVSTRQRQGGSLPCNVNAGVTSYYDKQFFEEMARKKVEDKKAEYTAIEMESVSLLEHDSLNQDYNESEVEIQTRIPRVTTKYTSRFNLDIGGGSANVDDSLTVAALERTADKILENDLPYSKPLETIAATNCIPEYLLPSLHSRNIFPLPKYVDEKKVDENCNALAQNDSKKNKKKKVVTDKNVVVLAGKDVVGHRSDIAHDVDKIMEFLGEQEIKKANERKTNSAKKQRTRSKGGKSEKMQKSNSMEEISVSKLDDFNFKECDSSGKVPLRSTKSNNDRPRERRSWGNSESVPLHASAENLESADFRVVTKKKKSKKIRNSIGRRQHYSTNSHEDDANRNSSPEPRRKSVCSVPHSDKSNDSSDVDSVHSLPIDTEHMNIVSDGAIPISYAEIAKHSNSLDRPRWNRPPSERKVQKYLDQVECDQKKNDAWQNNVIELTTNKKVKVSPNNLKNNIKNVQPNRTMEQICVNAVPVLPHNIPDVQTIEKMHFKQLQQAMENRYGPNYQDVIASHLSPCNYAPPVYVNEHHEQSHVQYVQKSEADTCDSERTNARPAVVILSGNGKEVSGLTFGFEVNEQLLSDDVCDYFTSRFYVPDVFQKHNHDKIVNFIGLAWEDTLNQSNAKVKYFSDQL